METILFLSLICLTAFIDGQNNFSSSPLIGIDDVNKDNFPKNEDNDTLKFVAVMFRHGNRTTRGLNELYPKDPYLNYSYFPIGHGQLTNVGKVRAFAVGTALRKRYNKFLGKFYYPGIVKAYSSDSTRTKMSIQLALAGLFPPTKQDVALTGINWQPVPYEYVLHKKDRIFAGYNCPKYSELYKKYISSPHIQSKFRSYQKTFDYISKHSGLNIKTIESVYNLYLGLATEEEYGLVLPEWTKLVWPDTITKLAVEEYYISMGHLDMKRMAIGYFLEKLLDDLNNKIRDTNNLSRKIHIYASHENVMAYLLLALGVFEREIPNYTSYIIFELHKIKDVYGIKIFYENWNGKGLRLLKMPNCKEFCPLATFKLLLSDILPTPGLCDV